MLTLYAESLWDSPWVLAVFVTLEEKGIEYEVRTIDLSAGEQHSTEYTALSLTSKVPCIDHDGFLLSESAAIIEYLEEVFPPPDHPRLLPELVRDRARARQIMSWLRTDLMPLREARPTSSIFFDPVKTPLSAAAKKSAEKLVRVSERLIPESGPLFGRISVPDFDLSTCLMRLIANSDPVPARLERYAKQIWARPSVQDFVAKDRPKFH